MPIYEYRCPNGHTFEVFQRMTDPPADACQVCGSGPVEKLLFPVAVHFKGSGFYSTDYGRGSSKDVKEREGDKTPAKDAPAPSEKAGTGEKSAGGDKKAGSAD